ncbi:glycoside hydrolase family 97 protein [Catenovulum agarivorans]|uniref:glycoside hydrolase family 97 protein n=1 Tax=Catenovulum agarivorans TaxID=1172192 RepID=UPI0003145C84|nr:glycoside hydrolase family 97 protein [Catenovulum agarivorans]
MSLLAQAQSNSETIEVLSPNGQVKVSFLLEHGSIYYQVGFKNMPIINKSSLGFELLDKPQLAQNFKIVASEQTQVNQSWQAVWGENAQVENNYTQAIIRLAQQDQLSRQLNIHFRVFNDGVGFRYEFPQQPNLTSFAISKELTQFAMAENYTAWWIPAYRDQRYEYQYLKSALSSIDYAHTPLLMQNKKVAVAIHEAALVDYASMTLKLLTDNHKTLEADLVPWANGVKVYAQAPMSTPWRTIQVADSAVQLINSNLILNLNEENKLQDVSWIEPSKYMGIWWEMHIGQKSWSPGPMQGATTERAKQYIDFAAKHNIKGVLVEGWNKGWEGNWWERKPTFIFDQAVDGFDLAQVSQYAQEKGVELVGHHETAAGIAHYEAQMEQAFAYYQKHGIRSVKMGYVGTRVDGGEWHHGQFMVRHFNKLIKTAAKYQIMVNAHETIKDTGLRRTYPNMMTRECVRGMEYNGGSPDGGNLPNHTVIIPFTRGLSGPTDFTPGIFNFAYQEKRPNNRVPTTLAKQLALYVTIYSPQQMAADLPENYQDHPAFQFIYDVPTDWRKSIALAGDVGEYLVVARQDKHSEQWFLGATSNEDARNLSVQLDFLPKGQKFKAVIYADGANAHWQHNPAAYQITSQQVTAKSNLSLQLAAGGGAAVQFIPVN